MPKSPTPASGTSEPKTRKGRTTTPRHYKVTGLHSEDGNPTLVLAKTQADVLAHIINVTPATPEDLMDAGRSGWSLIDLVNPFQSKPLQFGGTPGDKAGETA